MAKKKKPTIKRKWDINLSIIERSFQRLTIVASSEEEAIKLAWKEAESNQWKNTCVEDESMDSCESIPCEECGR